MTLTVSHGNHHPRYPWQHDLFVPCLCKVNGVYVLLSSVSLAGSYGELTNVLAICSHLARGGSDSEVQKYIVCIQLCVCVLELCSSRSKVDIASIYLASVCMKLV